MELLLLCSCQWIIILFFLYKRKPHFIAFILLASFLIYSTHFLIQWGTEGELVLSSTEKKSLLFTSLSHLVTLVFYFLSLRPNSLPPKNRMVFSISLWWILLSISLILIFPLTFPRTTPIANYLSSFLFVFFLTYLKSSSEKTITLIFYILLGFIFFLVTGSLRSLFFISVFLFLHSLFMDTPMQTLWTLPLVVFLCLLQSIKSDFRKEMNLPLPALTALEPSQSIHALIRLGREHHSFEQIPNSFLRIGEDSLQRVLEFTPERIPFSHGSTYLPLLFFPVPRLVWPEKPQWKHWNQFGRDYGYLNYDDYKTSVSLGYIAESYMNFGVWGLILLSAIFGVIIAMTENFVIYRLNILFPISNILSLFPLLNLVTSFGPLVLSLLMTLLMLWGTQEMLLALDKLPPYARRRLKRLGVDWAIRRRTVGALA